MVGLSKADVKRTFNTYALGQKSIDVDEAYEMFQDLDDDFKETLENFKVQFEQYDANHDNRLDFEEAWKLYRHYYPVEEYM